MASQRNRTYPLNEYNTINTDVLNVTTGVYAPALTGSDVTTKRVTAAVNTGTTSGSIIISGFTAQAAVRQYQPVVLSNDGAGIFVSGATQTGQKGIIGVAAAAASANTAVSVITMGLVPYITSGAIAITKGGPVIYAFSGSKDCVIDLAAALAVTSGSKYVLGIAAITGSAAVGATVHVWVSPGEHGHI